MKTKSIFTFLIMAILLVTAGFFAWNKTSYSKEVLKLEILGPSEVMVGESIEYVVRFKNNGNIRLENPELIFEYPDEAIIESDKNIIYDSKKLGGDIYPGQERTFRFKARLLGQEGEIRIAKATVSFKPKELNTRTEVSTEFLATIKSVPIDLNLNLPQKIGSADKAFSFNVNYRSEVPYTMEDLSIFLIFPNDFEFLYSTPKSLDEEEWSISKLEQYESGQIEISGVLNSIHDSAFVAKVGLWNNNEFIVLKEETRWVSVVTPALYVTQKINNNYDYVANLGDSLHYEIIFRNVSDESITDLVLISKLDGDIFDLNSLNAPNAKYTKGDNSILFEGRSFDNLQYLDVDEQGVVEFWIDLKDDLTMLSLAQANQRLKNSVSIGQTREAFITKINTQISANQYVDTSDTFFKASGPYPLQVNKTSKITIVWEALNSFNRVEEAKMRAILPENSVFVEHDEYEEMGLSYNKSTSELVWDIGSIDPGEGYVSGSKKVAFQIIISPQIVVPGGVLLAGPAHIAGIDQWTEAVVDYKTESFKGEMVGGNIAN